MYFYIAATILVTFIVFMLVYIARFIWLNRQREKNIHRVLRGNR